MSSETDEKIHGNQKLQCQWRPGKFCRTKKLNSVKKSIHPYPDFARQKKIKDSLKVGQTFTNNLVKNSVEFLSIETPKILGVIPKINLSDSLIYNGCHTLCLIDLLSLETNLSDSDIYRIRCSFARFKKGWLHDEVINSYMYMLTQENGSNLHCGSTEAMIIVNNKDFSRLLFNQNLENIERVIIPFNPTNSHWILPL